MHPTDRTLRQVFDVDRFAITQTVVDHRWLAPAVLAARERQAVPPHRAACTPIGCRPIRRELGARRWLGTLLVRLGVRLGGLTPIEPRASPASPE